MPSTARRWRASWSVSLSVAALALGCRASMDARSVHAPFSAHACAACHDTEGSLSFGVYATTFALPKPPSGSALEPSLDDKTRSRLRFRVDQLCFQCHKALDPGSPEMRGLWLHGPFRAGVCTGCHDPHRSDHRRLLAAYPWEELCARCHSDIHGGKGAAAYSRDCRACHSPHAQHGPTTK